MQTEPIITTRSIAKLMRAGFKIFRIPAGYPKAIHITYWGKWEPNWKTYQQYRNNNEAQAAMDELLKDEKNIQVK